jgi:hypothetical protein
MDSSQLKQVHDELMGNELFLFFVDYLQASLATGIEVISSKPMEDPMSDIELRETAVTIRSLKDTLGYIKNLPENYKEYLLTEGGDNA